MFRAHCEVINECCITDKHIIDVGMTNQVYNIAFTAAHTLHLQIVTTLLQPEIPDSVTKKHYCNQGWHSAKKMADSELQYQINVLYDNIETKGKGAVWSVDIKISDDFIKFQVTKPYRTSKSIH